MGRADSYVGTVRLARHLGKPRHFSRFVRFLETDSNDAKPRHWRPGADAPLPGARLPPIRTKPAPMQRPLFRTGTGPAALPAAEDHCYPLIRKMRATLGNSLLLPSNASFFESFIFVACKILRSGNVLHPIGPRPCAR